MRIIAGKLKGSTLYVPKDKNTRPLKDLVRESIFNLLTHSNKISLQFEQSNILADNVSNSSVTFPVQSIQKLVVVWQFWN